MPPNFDHMVLLNAKHVSATICVSVTARLRAGSSLAKKADEKGPMYRSPCEGRIITWYSEQMDVIVHVKAKAESSVAWHELLG